MMLYLRSSLKSLSYASVADRKWGVCVCVWGGGGGVFFINIFFIYIFFGGGGGGLVSHQDGLLTMRISVPATL